MSGGDPSGPDLLEGGRERSGWAWVGAPLTIGDRVRPLARRHRATVAAVVAAATVVSLLGYHWYIGRPVDTPPVTVIADRSTDPEPLWSAGSDGRPRSPVSLSVAAWLSDPARRADSPQVVAVGLAGPGVSHPGAFPTTVLGTIATSVELTGQVACDQVPLPLPADLYSVRLEVLDGLRRDEGLVPLGASAAELANRVTVGCSTWLAARDLTVTDVRATVDPLRPHVDLVLQVHNAGLRTALVWTPYQDDTGTRVSSVVVRVPALTTLPVALSVDLDSCWTWSPTSVPVTTADTPVSLLGAEAVAAPLPPDALPISQPANGVVLDPQVAARLQAALVAACGGIAAPILLTATGQTGYDAARGVLTVHAVVNLPAGQVELVRFRPSTAQTTDLQPLFSAGPWTVPSPGGQADFTAAFAATKDELCVGGGPFVTMDVEAVVASPAGQRHVVFSLAAQAEMPTAVVDQACRML
jgi:hypothetical protein